MRTLNYVVAFVLVLFVAFVSVACDWLEGDGGGSPTAPTMTTTDDNPGPEPYWYDDTLYNQLVYDAYQAAPLRNMSRVLVDPRGYDIVFSRADPGGRCTITDDTITVGDGSRHTFRKLFNFALRHDGATSSPFWPIHDDPSQARWTGRFYSEENAQERPGRFVVRFSSGGRAIDSYTVHGSALIGALAPEIWLYYDYNCALRSQTLAGAANPDYSPRVPLRERQQGPPRGKIAVTASVFTTTEAPA